MLPYSTHHTTGHHSHLDRKGVSIFDEEGLYSEALAERCSLVNSSQGYSLICVEAPGKVGPGGRGEGRGGKRRGGEGDTKEMKGLPYPCHLAYARTHTCILIFHTAPYSIINIT